MKAILTVVLILAASPAHAGDWATTLENRHGGIKTTLEWNGPVPLPAHAACPEIPAAERVRIVECRSGYAVQELVKVPCTGLCSAVWPTPMVDTWKTRIGCGTELMYARRHKADIIEELEIADLGNCAPPNLPLEPVRVVE
jgi:hypothetical protein